MAAAAEADLMLAVGTTLQVYPVAGAVPLAKDAGARVVIMNDQPTSLDDIADAVLRGPIGELLPAICGSLGTPRPVRIEQIRQRLRSLGAGPGHEQRVLRLWAQALPQDSGRRPPESFLPKALRDALPALADELAGLARLRSRAPGGGRLGAPARRTGRRPDGGERAAAARRPVRVDPGRLRGRLRFCMTGRDGLLRQLGSAEIVAQVVLARSLRPVRKVVFMGMGEPAHNLDNVLEAIELLGTAGGIGHKNLVFSTVGDARVFERLPLGTVKPALALSLHSTKAELRAALLPRAPRIDPAEMVALGERYARATGYPIQYQWTLLEGINDGDDELDGIVALLAGKYAMMNMIPYNAVDGLAFRRPLMGARRGDRALAEPARHPDPVAAFRGAGRGGRLRPAARTFAGRRRGHGPGLNVANEGVIVLRAAARRARTAFRWRCALRRAR